jgi:hypothetical protein
MAWDEVNGRRYYYRSERVDGRPVRRYVGKGDVAELAAAADAARRVEREIEARQRQAEQTRLNEAEAPLVELCELTDILVRAALVVAGFHQHARGSWRKRRGPKHQTT